MQQMADPRAEDDARLWALAYIGFFVRDDHEPSRRSRRLMESNAKHTAQAVGALAVALMDVVWLPVNYGVELVTPWWEVEALRRSDPRFAGELARRRSYARLARGLTLMPRTRLRQVAADVVGMLWTAYQAEAGPDGPLLYGSLPVLIMLDRFRSRVGHPGGSCGNA